MMLGKQNIFEKYAQFLHNKLQNTHILIQLRNTRSKRNGIKDTTNQLTFVEAWKSAVIPIWIGLDFSDKGDTWGEIINASPTMASVSADLLEPPNLYIQVGSG